MLGWSAGLPLTAWLILAPASLLGASWVPSLPLLPKVRIDSPPLRASGTGEPVPITLPVPPTTQGAGGEITPPTGANPSATTPGATAPSVVPTTRPGSAHTAPTGTSPPSTPTAPAPPPGAPPPSVVPTTPAPPTHTTPTHTTPARPTRTTAAHP